MSNPLPPFDAPGVPAPIKDEMLDLRHHLDGKIPPKRDGVSNLLIATWNLKAFASLTETWTAGPNHSPKRDWRALWAITEIISRFDVIALQEVKGDLKALRTLLKTLGGDWQFLMTDVTRGHQGNEERLAFLFDARRIKLSGLACELVVPEERLQTIAPDALTRQFARTPYADQRFPQRRPKPVDVEVAQDQQVLLPLGGLLGPIRHPLGDRLQLGCAFLGPLAIEHVQSHENERHIAAAK
jgi:hypothetical protein